MTHESHGDSGPGDNVSGVSDGWRVLLDRQLGLLALGSTVVFVVASFVQLRYGSYPMTPAEVIAGLTDPAIVADPRVLAGLLLGGEFPDVANSTLILWKIRLPRILVGVMVGANLAVAGAIFQAITRNELASPYVLGVSAGAGLAVLVVLILVPVLSSYLPFVAAVGGTAAFLLVYAIAWQNGTSPVRLILAGIVVATIGQSLQTGLFFFAGNTGVVQTALSWLTGSLTGTSWSEVRLALPWTVLALGLAIAGSRQLNVLLLGEQAASSLGMRVERVRFGLSALAIAATAISVAVAGLVGFVGLVVPHLVRNIVGTDYRRLVIGCVFAGPALVTAADVGARLALSPIQLPVGIVTGLLGGPYFLYLMQKQRQLGEL
ncbi:iron ABC transporter permease [Halomicroarcula sp. S1AR25-4]|uniref:FecCD family ABC transporter permease n=1 Tax=Haloarcula sp. S1AR25-4 TaxID=2950538 RepID=UPI002874FDCF|nr:iron ABC transporter permease [Halomicroarcula sp. S1AR25-4]MDS0276626.1 iron ABC transporter permease [Halomicroarcula sp. S1AR25-4]